MSFEVIVFVYTNWQDVGIQTHDDLIQSSANHLVPPPYSFQGYILFLIFKFYGWPYMCIVHYISIGSVVSRTLATGILDSVIIAYSLKSIRPGLALGCKAPNGVG